MTGFHTYSRQIPSTEHTGMIAPHTCGVILRVGTESDHDRLTLLQRLQPVQTPPAHGTLAHHARSSRGLGCGVLCAGRRCSVACAITAGWESRRHVAGVLVVAQRRETASAHAGSSSNGAEGDGGRHAPSGRAAGVARWAEKCRAGISTPPASSLQMSLPIE